MICCVLLCYVWMNLDEWVPSSFLGFFHIQFHIGRPDPQGWHVVQSGRSICDTSMYFLRNFPSCQGRIFLWIMKTMCFPVKCLSNSQLSRFEFPWKKFTCKTGKNMIAFWPTTIWTFLTLVLLCSSWDLESSPVSAVPERYLTWSCQTSCHLVSQSRRSIWPWPKEK